MTAPLQSFLSGIIDAVADPIFVKDANHNFVLLNEAMCDFLGYKREELIGKSDFDFFPEEEALVFWAKDDEVFQSGETIENEERLTGADGNTYTISTKKSVFINEKGEKILVGVIRDLTQLKSTEQELRIARDEAQEASAAKSQFLANASHELRTPLNGIVGMVELLQDRPWEGELKELIHVLRDSADNLLALVNDLLEFSAMDAGRVSLRMAHFEPRGLLHSTVTLFEHQARKKQVALSFQISPDVPQYLFGDQNRIRQILVNLISNSVKFTPPQGVVTVSVSLAPDDRIRYEVVDDGLGIPPEKLDSVFLPFAKARDTDQGTGLGLPICRQLAQLMSGRLDLQSPEGGCQATLELPLQSAHPHDAEPGPQDEKLLTFPGLRVLVVEDDPVSQKVAELTLKRLLCDVALAEDGVVALGKLESETFDLILMDCRMPNLDGYETVRKIRMDEKNADSRVTIFALTAHAFEEDMEKCLSAGMDRWLTKPLQKRALVSAIATYF
jgi:PAS domain S-box-containing protein